MWSYDKPAHSPCHPTLHHITCNIRDYRKVTMKRHFRRHLLGGARRYVCENGLRTGPHSCGYRKVTMKCRFRRHLLGGRRRYVCENGLRTGPYSCGCRKVTMKRRFRRHLPGCLNAHSKPQRAVDKKFFPDCKPTLSPLNFYCPHLRCTELSEHLHLYDMPAGT